MNPVHTHDCRECVFVGVDTPERGEPSCNQVDMYVHVCTTPNNEGRLVAIRRYGSEPENYGAMTAEAKIPKYQRVIAAYRKVA